MRQKNPPGTYILKIELSRSCNIEVGSLGNIVFEKGFYLYVGSALSGLRTRLGRHLRTRKRPHWHIDYLLHHGRVREIWYHLGTKRYECAWARILKNMPQVEPLQAPFGASDCGCRTHLFCSKDDPGFRDFQAALDEETNVRKLEISSGESLDVAL